MFKVLSTVCLFLAVITGAAQDTAWPRSIQAPSGTIILYQPQPESFEGNKITARAAVSYTEDMGEPIFGAIWTEAIVNTDRDRRVASLESIKVTKVKLPANADTTRLAKFRALVEREIPKWNLEISLDQLAASLDLAEQEKSLAEGLKNDPPEIIYKNVPSFLVLIDGEPKTQKDDKLGVERVVNTPYVIVKNKDSKYYLYLSPSWFSASAPTGRFTLVETPPKEIISLEKKLKEKSEEKPGAKTKSDTIPEIIVATKPSELIQSRGDGAFTPILETNLLYMSNTDNDIFMEIPTQQYFVLLSGRWYTASNLNGPWNYVASDKLPGDFKKIPKGSNKDNVLASVAGTDEAKEALADAHVPQTAKVDRKKAKTTVKYDGEPKFEKIEGTTLEYAVNTTSTVLKSGSKYYAVDNGVWFESTKAKGPWKASTARPADVEKIPASNPAYNVKYVYIYDTTPEYIYMGYTSGYLGCYPYGPTVVYGTGWYYPPWYGPYYYPHPVTYGFGMHYNPWTGFSMSVGISFGYGFGMSFYGGGYWGPPMYMPPYRPPYGRYYGGRPVQINHYGDNNINRDRTNNVYNNRKDVQTRDNVRGDRGNTASTRPAGGDGANRPSTNPAMTREGTRMQNNVQTDRDGNLYRQNADRQWNERQGNDWGQTNQNRDLNNLNRTQQSRDAGQMRDGGFQQSNHGAGMGMGGGMRGGMGGGGGGRGRGR